MLTWSTFWEWVHKKKNDYEKEKKIPQNVIDWKNTREYNPCAVVNSKLTSLTCDEATFDVASESTLAEPLKELVKELEAKRYEICSAMNGEGGCFVTLAIDASGKPYHVILPPCSVSIYKRNYTKITELAMVIDRTRIDKKNYNLIRHHVLDENGTLTVYYYAADDNGKEAFIDEWAAYANEAVAYVNANHIGVAYYKSPQDSRGLSPLIGVPLNFGCEEAEAEIMNDREALRNEMKKATMKLFADKSITRMEKTKVGNVYDIPEDVFVIQKKAGADGGLIDEFAPQTRFADYEAKLEKSYEDYEKQIGINKGFLSKSETTHDATATEIRAANIKTISFVKRLQAAMLEGVKETLTADCVFLNIPLDVWTLTVDWFDAFEDYEKQYERLANAVDRGIAEKSDEMRWLFPNLTGEEIEEKLARIAANKSVNEDEALERLLRGE